MPTNHTFFEALRGRRLQAVGDLLALLLHRRSRHQPRLRRVVDDDGARTIAESNKDIASPRIVPRVIAKLRRPRKTKQRSCSVTHLFEPHSPLHGARGVPRRTAGVPGLRRSTTTRSPSPTCTSARCSTRSTALGWPTDTAIVCSPTTARRGASTASDVLPRPDLYDELLRVPLIIVIPGHGRRASSTTTVVLVDVGADAARSGGRRAAHDLRGRSLRRRHPRRAARRRPIFAELLPATAWNHDWMMRYVDGGWKIIHRISDNGFELYDLAAGPRRAEEPRRRDQAASEARRDEARDQRSWTRSRRPASETQSDAWRSTGHPLPTVDIIIEVGGGRIVLIERKNPPPGWALPGGFVDVGESLAAAARREAKEETVARRRARRAVLRLLRPAPRPAPHTVSTVFVARADGRAARRRRRRGARHLRPRASSRRWPSTTRPSFPTTASTARPAVVPRRSAEMTYAYTLAEDETKELLRIARATVKEYLLSGRIPPGAPHRPSLVAPAAVFVTLPPGRRPARLHRHDARIVAALQGGAGDGDRGGEPRPALPAHPPRGARGDDHRDLGARQPHGGRRPRRGDRRRATASW